MLGEESGNSLEGTLRVRLAINATSRLLKALLHYVLGKNASLLRFSRVFLKIFSRFCSQTFQNATPTHGVIWA